MISVERFDAACEHCTVGVEIVHGSDTAVVWAAPKPAAGQQQQPQLQQQLQRTHGATHCCCQQQTTKTTTTTTTTCVFAGGDAFSAAAATAAEAEAANAAAAERICRASGLSQVFCCCEGLAASGRLSQREIATVERRIAEALRSSV